MSIKIWLTQGQLAFAIDDAAYDDRLFVRLADHLAERAWLGPYDSFTLIKGPFFSLWITLMFAVGVPLLLSIQLLYALACGALVQALHPLLKRDLFKAVCFCVLLYNPAGNALQRIVRELIYTPLVMLVVAGALGLLLAVMDARRPVRRWAVVLGVALGCLWLTREEGVWVLPFIAFVSVGGLLWAYKNRARPLAQYAGAWGMALGLPVLMVLGVSTVNYSYYGLFGVTEMDARSFKAASGALTRVKPTEPKPYVPVTKETRLRIYRVSPAFRELEPFLEGPMQRWVTQGGPVRSERNAGEILGGWFGWAFRGAVDLAGHYGHGRYPDEYYTRLANEVNAACDNRQLECYPERTTLAPVWHWEYAGPMLAEMGNRLISIVRFEKLQTQPRRSQGSKASLMPFRTLTREEIVEPDGTSEALPSQQAWRLERYAALNFIAQVYQWTMPLLAGVSLLIYVGLSFRWLRQRTQPGWWLAQTALLILLTTRLSLISLIAVSSFAINNIRYVACVHAIVLTFVMLAGTELAESFRRRRIPP